MPTFDYLRFTRVVYENYTEIFNRSLNIRVAWKDGILINDEYKSVVVHVCYIQYVHKDLHILVCSLLPVLSN